MGCSECEWGIAGAHLSVLGWKRGQEDTGRTGIKTTEQKVLTWTRMTLLWEHDSEIREANGRATRKSDMSQTRRGRAGQTSFWASGLLVPSLGLWGPLSGLVGPLASL